MLTRYNSDCAEAESLYGVNDQLEAEREKYGGQASYGGEDGRLPGYGDRGGEDGRLPGYGGGGRGQQEDARLPGYRPRPAAPSKYGRDAKALELQDSVFLTTPPPPSLVTSPPLLSSLSLSPPLLPPSPPPITRRGRGRPIGEQEQNSKDKRELFSRRRTKKYSWAFK